MSRFFGRLVVSEGDVAFWPEGRANGALNVEPAKPIVHRQHVLTVVTGRLLPPWMNSGLLPPDGEDPSGGVGVILLTAWQRRAVVDAARSAGFDVTVHRTWGSAGGSIGSTAELDRFRRNHA